MHNDWIRATKGAESFGFRTLSAHNNATVCPIGDRVVIGFTAKCLTSISYYIPSSMCWFHNWASLLSRSPGRVFLLTLHTNDRICFSGGNCKQFEVRVVLSFENHGSILVVLAIPCKTVTAAQVVFSPKQTIT